MTKAELIKIMNDAILLNQEVSIALTSEYGDDIGEIRIIANSNITNAIKTYSENFDDELRMIGKPKIKIIEAKTISSRHSSLNISKEKVALCDDCYSYSKVTDNDEIFYGQFGLPYIRCHECGGEAYIENEDGITVDENNLEFPQHFYHFGVSKGAVEIKDEDLQIMARDAIRRLKEKKESSFTMSATGDSVIIALDFEDEIEVFVARNYYEFDYDKNNE